MNEDVFDAKPSDQSKAVAVFDPVKKLIADLEISVRDLVFNVQTEDGRKECTELVAKINKLRTRSDALRKEHTETHLKAQRELMAVFRNDIEAKCNKMVAPFQKLLDDEERRLEAIQREADEREAKRIRAHRDRIVAVRNLTSLALGKSADAIRQLVAAIPPADVVASMEEFSGEMQEAVDQVTPLLTTAILQAEEREDAKRREDALRAELAAAKAAQPPAPPPAPAVTPTAAPDVRQRRLDAMGLGQVENSRPKTSTPPEPRYTFIGGTTAPTRPSDDDIIDTLSLNYRVHESKVIEWLLAMDLKAASDRLLPF